MTIDTVVNEQAMPYMYIVNPLAMDISINNVKMICNGKDGGAYGRNKLLTIDPATSRVDNDMTITYYGTEDGASDDAGWYYTDDDETSAEALTWKSGDGFLCDFDPAKLTKLVFKNPLAPAE